MDYFNLVFEAGAEVGKSLIVFLLLAIMFDFIRKMLFDNR